MDKLTKNLTIFSISFMVANLVTYSNIYTTTIVKKVVFSNINYKDLTSAQEQEFAKLFYFDKNLKQKNENIAKLEQELITKLKTLNPKPGYLFKTTNFKGMSLIHIASSFPFYENFLQELLNRGEDPNLQTQDLKVTPLHFACQSGSIDNIKTLLSSGKIANLMAQDTNSQNPIHYLANIEQHKNFKPEYLSQPVTATDFLNKLYYITRYLIDFYIYNFGQTTDQFLNQRDKDGKLPYELLENKNGDKIENKKGFENIHRLLKFLPEELNVAMTMEYISDPSIRTYKSKLANANAKTRKTIDSTIILDIQKDPNTGKTIKLSDKQQNALRFINGNYTGIDNQINTELAKKWNLSPYYKFTTKTPEKIIVNKVVDKSKSGTELPGDRAIIKFEDWAAIKK